MTVTFRGREVEIVEVTLPQRDRLAELTDTLQGLGANGADVQTVSGWRSLAGPLMECARMFAPSLTDADYAAAKLSDLVDIYAAGVKVNHALRIVQEKTKQIGAAPPAPSSESTFVAETREQAEAYADLADSMGRPEIAEQYRKAARSVAIGEKLRPGSFSAVEA